MWGSSFLCLIRLPVRPAASASSLCTETTHTETTHRDHTHRDNTLHTETARTETTHRDNTHTETTHTETTHTEITHTQRSCADFVAGTALCEPPRADFVAGTALSERPCSVRGSGCRVVGGCLRWSPVRPSIVIRVCACFLPRRIL